MANAAAGKQYKVGRGGIKIPEIEQAGPYFRRSDVFSFFHRLWKLNGVEVPIERNEKGVPSLKEFAGRLIVPASAKKPIVVIEGSYVPTTKIDQVRQAYEGAVWADGESNNMNGTQELHIVKGRERHAVYVAEKASRVSQPSTLLSAEWGHSDAFMPWPYVGVDGYAQDTSEIDGFECSEHTRRLEEAFAAPGHGWPMRHGHLLQGLVADTVDLLSATSGQ